MEKCPEVGDWWFTVQNGWKRIKSINNYGNIYPIELSDHVDYTYDGKYYEEDKYPSAWPENHPDIPHWAPKRPRKKVIKTLHEWVNVFNDGSIAHYDSEETARVVSRAINSDKCIAVAVEMVGTYETEE